MGLWPFRRRREDRDAWVAVERTRESVLVRLADVESQLAALRTRWEGVDAALGQLQRLDKKVSSLTVDVTELHALFASLRESLEERATRTHALAQSAMASVAGRSRGGRGARGGEAAQIGEEVLQALQSPETTRQLIRELQERSGLADGNGVDGPSVLGMG